MRSKGILKQNLNGWLFTLPVMLLLLFLMAIPAFRIVQFSLSEVELPSFKTVFVGFKNYQRVFSQPGFLNVLKNSMIWSLGCVFFQLTLGLGAALVLNQNIKGRIFFRGATLLPFVIPGVVTAYIWKWLYNYDFGMINEILRIIGVGGLARGWLTDERIALYAAMGANIWWLYPFSMIVFLGGLQGIPKELYEAARIDGANSLHAFRYVTIPWLRPVIVIATLLQGIWSLNTFTLILIMTGGGPANATDLFGMYIYREAFYSFRFEVAAAAAVVMVVFMMITGFSYLRLSKVEGL